MNNTSLTTESLQSPQDPACQYMDIGTPETPNFVVRNWCPQSGEFTYYIQDARAIEDSLVLFNIQRNGTESAPTCMIRDTGELPFPPGSLVTTGFILDCNNNINPVIGDKLIYTVLSSTLGTP